ncbi:MAG: CRISPR-associated endoribonuclease Cas6, partial [Nitrospirae bacterium]
MRLKVSLRGKKLPILYRHRFMAFIKEALNQSDAYYKETLYPGSNSPRSKVTKPFTFSLYIPPGFTQKKEKFFIDEDLQIEDT